MIMRTSLENIRKALKAYKIPKQITQEPFDHDPSHYQRLCNLHGKDPAVSDLYDYALDMTYMELQPELLRYLTPVLLAAWRKDLFDGDQAGYAGFVEQFWCALLKGSALKSVFTEVERAAFSDYLRETLFERMDTENSLRFSGMRASPYRWIETLVSYGVLFPDIETLWTEWWQMETTGHAITAFQFASALMYEADKNPVFDPWTRGKGGGPPAVWSSSGFMFDVGWNEGNLNFLKRTLSVAYVEQNLRAALDKIEIGRVKEIASRIMSDFPNQTTLLSLRIEELSKLLTNTSQFEGFTI
jgi:hypothetical protein